jgi:deoxyribodipyrimidine photo-lyase
MNRGAAILAKHAQIGEQAAINRLSDFTETAIGGYQDDRNNLDIQGTSGLSPHLALGEVSIHRCWAAGQSALQSGKRGAETFLKELAWRDFAHHLMYHQPSMETENWNDKWDGFPWNTDESRPDVVAWKQGRTGYPIIDAAMRELYTTGIMHNRARMIVASFLTKHLLTDWRVGLKWFEDCLIDWDIASNAMGWQWVAGSGPDAAPFFRIFNPESQAAKFDPRQSYQTGWIAEGLSNPSEQALDYFTAIPRSWAMSPHDIYPQPTVSLKEGRERALARYKDLPKS